MNFSKLIFNNVTRSARKYFSYFLSSVFSVFIFFMFAMLNFHPQLKRGLGGSSETVSSFAEIGMTASQVLIVLLSFIFLWYSFWTYVKARKAELSVYLMLGMKPRDLRKLLFGENMVIGCCATVTGIGLGVIFSKAMLIVVGKLLHLEKVLSFYFPAKGIVLTLIVYSILFFIVSFLMIIQIQTKNLNQLGKSDLQPQPLPKIHPLLVILAIVCLFLGYSSLAYFVYRNQTPLLLVFCVLLTVLGTFLFFHQAIVYFYHWCQKRSFYWRGKNLLTVSDGLYKAKENATMYALIACTAAVALVAICVTTALGSAETGSRSSITPAYVISSNVAEAKKQPSEELGNQVWKFVTDAGQKGFHDSVATYALKCAMDSSNPDMTDNYYFVYLMKESDYNRLAKKLNLEPLHPDKDELLEPATTINEYNQNKKAVPDKLKETIIAEFEHEKTRELNARKVPVHFKLAPLSRLFIAQDNLVMESMNVPDIEFQMIYQIIDFKNWQETPELNQKIETFLSEQLDKEQALMDQIINESDSIEEQDKKLAAANLQFFNYASKYQIWMEQRQANGMILIIGVLLGGVFFLFAGSIIYFRLFGELDKEGRYHRSLYQLGFQPKQRHQMITRQMLMMYFAPMFVAFSHCAVAFWGIIAIAQMDLWNYFWIINGSYLAVFFLLFLLSRWRYLIHLDLRAEEQQKIDI
ncbi:ABC transporter permease [Enterococcus sp. LJL99]